MTSKWSIRFVGAGLLTSLILPSCSQLQSERMPASKEGVDLFNLFASISSDVTAGTDSSFVCGQELHSYYERLLSIRSQDVQIENYSSSELESVLETSFKTRLEIMDKLRALTINNVNDQKCLGSVQDVIRALRYGEDYIAEVLIARENPKALKEEYINLMGKAPYLLVNPKFQFRGIEDLHGGDIILSRGNAYSSAAIARIGTYDTQFSHMSFVYEDEEGNLHTTEAHIEIGNVVAPLKTHIDQANARTVVFRYKDPKIARLASKLIYQKVKRAMDSGKNISYDFAMDLNDSNRLFCSEVVYDGFQMASKGKIDVPRFKTKFNKGLIPFLQTLGININENNVNTFRTFAPGDIQFDSDFTLIAEWRNPAKMKDNRQKDAILTMLFKWMEEDNYQFRPSFMMDIKAQVAWLARRLPIVKKKLKEQFPLNMTTDQLKLFFVLDQVAEPLQNYLEEEHKKNKNPLTPIEMYDALESFRKKDLINYRKWLKYQDELQGLEQEREGGSARAFKLRKLIKKHTPVIHERFRPGKV